MPSPFDIALMICAALTSGSLAYIWIRDTKKPSRTLLPDQDADDICYLFDRGVLQHASAGADAFYALEPGYDEWADLHEKLVARFPLFPARPSMMHTGDLTLSAEDSSGPMQIKIRWKNAFSHVSILPAAPDQGDSEPSILGHLRHLTKTLSMPVWQTDQEGTLLWCNQVYKDTHASTFPDHSHDDVPLFDPSLTETSQRVSLRDAATDKKQWYEVTRTEIDGILSYQAICVSALVHAEEAQRNFVQTLAKTFAQLSIGLAIFDRNKQLVLFNPALVDLTGLKAEFLSGRPSVESFFDLLRETRRMPEPKNYKNWRIAISDLIRAANDGRYEETWSLDSGQTYRVKGRPHPDGATAFLIEDISAEVSLTRNFRAELELGQSMLDTLDDGIAVFSRSGILTFSNAAYQGLWQVHPETSFADVTIHDAIQDWRRKCAPNQMWEEIESFVRNFGDRKPWSLPVYLADGAQLTCLMSPIVAGATLVRFHIVKKLGAPIEPSHPKDVLTDI